MPAKGYIQAHVFTSRANLPLADAAVTIQAKEADGCCTLFSLQLTNCCGNTSIIPINAPPVAETQAPGRAVGFSLVNIVVDLPDYEQVIVENVQVFPDTITLQDVQMLPREALPTQRGQPQVYIVTPQNL
ncbi:MAG: hypothetical protein VB055_07850 [Oscillospiraceae bacterium]|nr:hypothetical protein [Oscillospiraceae bacterium]